MDKLEKHIKEKLEERTIAPSSKAWDRIAPQIASQYNKKGRKWYVYAVAASFVGILLLSVLFFGNDKAIVEQNQVVEENVGKDEAGKGTGTPSEEVSGKVLPKFEETKLANVKIEQTQGQELKDLPDELPVSQPVLVEQETKQPIQDKFIKESDVLILQKVEEVVAQVEHLETLQSEVSDAEVDSLLRKAQRQIMADKLFTKSGSVDAMTLLAEVEDELDESFRDQIFDALKEGYFKLRTAVADRNQ